MPRQVGTLAAAAAPSAIHVPRSALSFAPYNRNSTTGAPDGLSSKRFAQWAACSSNTPPGGTPNRRQPIRPRSCNVAAIPGSRISKTGSPIERLSIRLHEFHPVAGLEREHRFIRPVWIEDFQRCVTYDVPASGAFGGVNARVLPTNGHRTGPN